MPEALLRTALKVYRQNFHPELHPHHQVGRRRRHSRCSLMMHCRRPSRLDATANAFFGNQGQQLQTG